MSKSIQEIFGNLLVQKRSKCKLVSLKSIFDKNSTSKNRLHQ